MCLRDDVDLRPAVQRASRGGPNTQTLPVAMYTYVGGLVSTWNKIFAVVIISMIPILAFYMFAQKQFIQGFAGGIKG